MLYPYLSAAAAIALGLAALTFNFFRLLIRQRFSPLRNLPGPPCPSFLMGNLQEMHDQENTNLIAKWENTHGSTFVYRGFIGGCRLMTTDPVAVAHILHNAYDYPKPDFVRHSLATMAAGNDGLLTVEGDIHKRQRKIISKAFSPSHIKSLCPIFWEKAFQLRDIWLTQIDSEDTAHSKGVTRIDALSWLGRATLDVIGLAGFGYVFNSLRDEQSELANAFSVIFSTARKFRIITILQAWFPVLVHFRRNKAAMIQAHATMRRIGIALIAEKRQEVLSGEKATSRDLLSVLIRSNMSSQPGQQMSVDEVLCQISTFLAAGHETSASAMTWSLYALSRNLDVQRKLRTELHKIEQKASSQNLDQDSLVSLLTSCEYLDWVVRESLRLHSPVTSTMRVCMRDEDAIPVSSAGVIGRDGVKKSEIVVRMFDIIMLPIQAINKSEALWGPDAGEFKPERWACPPNDAKSITGVYSNMLTFLSGNRACIGYQFALMEIKIFLYVLLKDIEFTIDPDMVIEKKVNVVTRPFVKSEPQLGNQMPLHVRRAHNQA